MVKKWIRLDNTSNIFLAARNDTDTKVFRLSATMKETVNPVILQQALDSVYDEYPLFHCVLRQGIFWYYLEPSDAHPYVKTEYETPCTPIYRSGRRNLLFRVLYREKHIHLEVFHALTDGTGAMWFFEDLLVEYAKQHLVQETKIFSKREKADLEDSFNRYFNDRNEMKDTTEELEVLYDDEEIAQANANLERTKKPKGRVYQIKGQRTQDKRPRVISLDMDVAEALKCSRREGVSLTIFMTALYLLAVYESKPKKGEETTISVSIPINLRQFFPSISVRNFFSTTTLFYIFKPNEIVELNNICHELDRQFKKQLKKDALEKRLKKFISFEKNPLARTVPRIIKDPVLRLINKLNNQKITVAMSNLGLVKLPQPLSDAVDSMAFYTSVIRPQFCMVAYGDNLNITFTSPFIETDIHKHFVQSLAKEGIEATIDVNKVTNEELETR